MSAETMYETQGEFSPLHERADPEFGRFLKRAFRRLAPFAARLVAGGREFVVAGRGRVG